MTLTVTSTQPSPPLDDYPRSLRDGRTSLVGLIDGYPSYYDRRRHRIDVLLEDGGGSRYLSEYYRLQSNETVYEYVRRAERNGYDCEVLARWTPRRHGHRTVPPVPRRLRRYARGLYARLVRWTHRGSEKA